MKGYGMKYVGLAIMILGGIKLYLLDHYHIAPPYFVWGVICIIGAVLYATHRHDPRISRTTRTEADHRADAIENPGPGDLTWHCPCGEINVRSAEVCRSCGADRPAGDGQD